MIIFNLNQMNKHQLFLTKPFSEFASTQQVKVVDPNRN